MDSYFEQYTSWNNYKLLLNTWKILNMIQNLIFGERSVCFNTYVYVLSVYRLYIWTNCHWMKRIQNCWNKRHWPFSEEICWYYENQFFYKGQELEIRLLNGKEKRIQRILNHWTESSMLVFTTIGENMKSWMTKVNKRCKRFPWSSFTGILLCCQCI